MHKMYESIASYVPDVEEKSNYYNKYLESMIAS